MDISGLSAEAVFAKHCFVSDTTMRETLSSLVLGGQPLIAGYGEARLGDFQQSLLQATFSAGYISKQAMDQLLAAALQTESGTYQAIAKSVSTPWTAKPPEYPIAFSEFKAWRDSSSAWVYKRDSKTLMKKLEHDLQEAGAEKVCSPIFFPASDARGCSLDRMTSMKPSSAKFFAVYRTSPVVFRPLCWRASSPSRCRRLRRKRTRSLQRKSPVVPFQAPITHATPCCNNWWQHHRKAGRHSSAQQRRTGTQGKLLLLTRLWILR